jgi:hypothetical protein
VWRKVAAIQDANATSYASQVVRSRKVATIFDVFGYAIAMPTGSCLCGAVSFEVRGELEAPDACHCTMCRRQSGHHWASTNVARADLTVHGSERVTWYQSSDKVKRGFCSVCGSVLFWDPLDREWLSIGMGAFNAPTGTKLHVHIFVGDKGDYYELGDGLEQRKEY